MDVLVATWHGMTGVLSVDGAQPLAVAIATDVADHILRNAGYHLAGPWMREGDRPVLERLVFREVTVTSGT